MLNCLKINDVAVVESVELVFDRGLNVLTGETGAGKSIVVGSLELLRGGRASSDVVRTGKEQASIEASFDIGTLPALRAVLDEKGIPTSDDELVIKRVISKQGKSRIYVNGSLTTASLLEAIAVPLFDITGQHEFQFLADRNAQRQIVDAVLSQKQDSLVSTMREAYRALYELDRACKQTEQDEAHRAERLEFLRFQVQELESAKFVKDEEEELERDYKRLSRAAELRDAAYSAESELYAQDRAICGRLSLIERSLNPLIRADDSLEPIVSQLQQSRMLLEELARTLGQYARSCVTDAEALASIEERLALLHRLKKKYRLSINELVEKTATLREEIMRLESLEARREALASQVDTARTYAAKQAERLSRERSAVARRLSKKIVEQLELLHMKGARFEIHVEPREPKEGDEPAFVIDGKRLNEFGWDRVEFMISTNAGESLKPLSRVASGGELSRITLAIKCVLREHDPVVTAIFDEVDAGISGAVADVVGQLLAEIAKHRQVLCVTHLPQVAAYANQHFCVQKQATNGRTATQVTTLDDRARVEELARMLGTKKVTEQARENARALIFSAGTYAKR